MTTHHVTIEYANCLSDRVGAHGLDPATLAPESVLAQAARAHTATLAQRRGTGWERWRTLVDEPARGAHVRAVKALAAKHAGAENLVVLGIGGSALGNIALQSALNPATHNMLPAGRRKGPRLFVIDNVDPTAFADVMDAIEEFGGPSRTVFNVVSKSGETAETAAQFMIIRDMLRSRLGAGFASRIVAITDEHKGTMRQICARDGYDTLPVPDGVGGRFSVLSPVGLFSAAMCGIDIDALLDGARDMDKRCGAAALAENPAATLAGVLVELGTTKGKPNHVLMPYANGLYLLADWYRQLWAESLGKEKDLSGRTVFAGFTPIKALGATDQHSQIQLYREGPNDKVIGFVEVGEFARDVAIPRGMGVPAIEYLEGSSLGALLGAEKRATEYALIESQRPNYTIRFPKINAYHVGEFIMLWQVATAYAGLMLNVDAYDQPAVELGKQATFGLMGRAGYEGFRGKVEGSLSRSARRV
jgi:glucose-6-phosphate isomerase